MTQAAPEACHRPSRHGHSPPRKQRFRPGRAIDCGSAHLGHVPGAALLCKPRAAPAGAGCWLAPEPPCDRVGHQSHESRTPRPTRNHRAHAVPRSHPGRGYPQAFLAHRRHVGNVAASLDRRGLGSGRGTKRCHTSDADYQSPPALDAAEPIVSLAGNARADGNALDEPGQGGPISARYDPGRAARLFTDAEHAAQSITASIRRHRRSAKSRRRWQPRFCRRQIAGAGGLWASTSASQWTFRTGRA